MKLKPITAITVLSLVVASILVSGCTTSITNQTPSANTTSSTATHDAFLEKYLAAYKNTSSTGNFSQKAWQLTWVNSTSAHLNQMVLNKTTNVTWNSVSTIMVFPTTQEATNYLNAMNKTGYGLASTEYPSAGAYQLATGHAPQVFKDYEKNVGNPSNTSEYTRYRIQQLDNIIFDSILKPVG